MKKEVVVLVLIVMFLVSACSQEVPSNKQCVADTDCVQDVCCHAKGAVNKDFAPGCKDILCSLSCEPDTLDCGEGEITCVNSQCEAIIS